MIFNNKFNRTYNSVILIEDQHVTSKYLGCFFTENMCDADDMKGLCILLIKVLELDFENFIHSILNHFIL